MSHTIYDHDAYQTREDLVLLLADSAYGDVRYTAEADPEDTAQLLLTATVAGRSRRFTLRVEEALPAADDEQAGDFAAVVAHVSDHLRGTPSKVARIPGRNLEDSLLEEALCAAESASDVHAREVRVARAALAAETGKPVGAYAWNTAGQPARDQYTREARRFLAMLAAAQEVQP